MDWPPDLLDDLARRRAILYLGAGVSRNSQGTDGKRPPLWLEFLNLGIRQCSGRKQHIRDLLESHDYLTACEIIKEKLGDEWKRLLRREFVDPSYKAAPIHEEIFKLDTHLVLTQNFDKIYDTYAQSASENRVAVKNYYDEDTVDVLRGDARAIIKVHGTIDSPAKMVFTRSDYGDAREKHARFYDCIDALLITHTFVFAGCDIYDPDMQLFLEKHARAFPTARPHIMLTPAGMHQDVKRALNKNLGLKILSYTPKDNHRELCDSLRDLRELVEGRREEMARRQSW